MAKRNVKISTIASSLSIHRYLAPWHRCKRCHCSSTCHCQRSLRRCDKCSPWVGPGGGL